MRTSYYVINLRGKLFDILNENNEATSISYFAKASCITNFPYLVLYGGDFKKCSWPMSAFEILTGQDPYTRKNVSVVIDCNTKLSTFKSLKSVSKFIEREKAREKEHDNFK